MNKLKRFRNNFLSLSFAQIIASILGSIIYFILARYLGPEKLGIYSLALSFGIIFSSLSNLGLDPLIVKDVSRNTTKATFYFSHAVILKLFGSTVCFIILFLVTAILKYDPEVQSAVLIFGISFFIKPLNITQNSIFRAYQKMTYSAMMNVARPIINISIILLMILLGLGVHSIVTSHIFTAAILFFIFYFYITKKHFCRFMLPRNFTHFWPIIQSAFPFVFVGITAILASRIDVLMISKMVGVKGVGLYSSAIELLFMLAIIPGMLSTVLFPSLSAAFGRSDNEELVNISRLAVKSLYSFGVPAGVGLYMLSTEIIVFLYGQAFVGADAVLRILSLNIIFFFPLPIVGWIITAIDKVKILMLTNTSALLFNVLLNLFLIPQYGISGAAISTVCSGFLIFPIICFIAYRNIPNFYLFRYIAKPVFAASLMGGLLLFLGDISLFIKIIVGVLAYVIIGLTISIYSKEELRILRQMFVRN